MLSEGLVQVYTSSGGQFNFAPVGLSIRAAGHGLRTLLTCLVPHELMETDHVASTLLQPNLAIDHHAFREKSAHVKPDADKILISFQRAKSAAISGEYDLVILNGINQFLSEGAIPLEEVMALIENKSSKVELVLTGQGAPEDLIERADLVTEMVVSQSPRAPGRAPHLKDTGPVEVITGNGKGKTTYCLGKAALSSFLGFRTVFLQFIKSPQAYGEVEASGRLPNFEIKTMGEGFLNFRTDKAKKRHLDAARRAWEHCLREIFSLKYGLVVLDEINTAAYYGLVHAERVREMVFLKPQNLQLLLSGRNAPSEVIASASTVIEMREIKHPFHRGVKARKGIEF